jgi:hypothetical protein
MNESLKKPFLIAGLIGLREMMQDMNGNSGRGIDE